MTTKKALTIDISDATEWPQSFPDRVELAVTLCMPDADKLLNEPVVLFCFPGGGYARHYYDLDLSHLPGCENESYSQVDAHLANGFIVVTCDHLCVGESTVPADPTEISLDHLTVANAAMVGTVERRLEQGEFGELGGPIRSIGIGQSMGGGITIGTQGDHACFEAVAVLAHGVSGSVPIRPEDFTELTDEGLAFVENEGQGELPTIQELWYRPDVPQSIVDEDMGGGYPVRKTTPIYGSLTIPPCAFRFIEPGFLAEHAARITSPVLIGYGDRDVLAYPEREPAAFSNAREVTVKQIPNMGHMHNFGSTRKQLWNEIETWIGSL